MVIRLFLLFTFVPLLELYILIRVGSRIGAANTIALVFATGLLGAWLAHREGVRTVARIRDLVGRGEVPGEAMLDALVILVAGIVLLTPGLVTDLAGLLLLVPFTRLRFVAWLRRALERRIATRDGRRGFR